MAGQLLGSLTTGIPFILSGPTGSGKTTLVQRLITEFSDSVAVSVSYTTRPARDTEVDGKHYHFVTQQEFEKRIAAEDFLEYVQLYGNYYGTSKERVAKLQAEGKHVFLVIDTQGARAIRSILPCVSIYITPPSLDELKRRLALRRTEPAEVIKKRLEWDKTEVEASRQYDYLVINDELENAYQILRSIVIAETHRNLWRCDKS